MTTRFWDDPEIFTHEKDALKVVLVLLESAFHGLANNPDVRLDVDAGDFERGAIVTGSEWGVPCSDLRSARRIGALLKAVFKLAHASNWDTTKPVYITTSVNSNEGRTGTARFGVWFTVSSPAAASEERSEESGSDGD